MTNATTKRKRKLIADILKDRCFNAFKHNMDRAEELQLLFDGNATVDMILDQLFSRKTSGRLKFFAFGSPVFHLLEVVEKLSGPQHAARVVEILSWDELLVGQDRSYRMLIPEILAKIGDSSVIPALEAFAEKAKAIQYSGGESVAYALNEWDQRGIERAIESRVFNEWDQIDIGRAIEACRTRQ